MEPGRGTASTKCTASLDRVGVTVYGSSVPFRSEGLIRWLEIAGSADDGQDPNGFPAGTEAVAVAGLPDITAVSVHDSALDAFYRMSLLGQSEGAPVSPQLVSECIAAYRLVLGRDPDEAGFRTFVTSRQDRSLVNVIGDLCGSPESIARHSPAPPPSPVDVSLASTQMALAVLQAAQTNVIFERLARIEQRLDAVAETSASIDEHVNRLSDYVMLRLDAHDP